MVSSVPTDFTANLARKRMAAGALFRDRTDRVLLVEPTYKRHWEIPGGSVEAGESPYAAVVRELQEELSLSVTVGRLLVVDWVPPRPHRTEAVLFIFDGGVLGPEQTEQIRLPEQELRSWTWCTLAEVHERTHELLARRLTAALRAHASTTTRYLEAGHPIV